jgi:hypothetical protein
VRVSVAMILVAVGLASGSGIASEAVEGAKKDFKAAKAEVAAQFDELDKKIDELKASTREKSTSAKEKALKEAQRSRDKLHEEFDSMKDTTASAWKAFKKRLSHSIGKISAKAQKALKD